MTGADPQIADLRREVAELREMVTDWNGLVAAAYEHGWRKREEAMGFGSQRAPRAFRPPLHLVVSGITDGEDRR